MKNVKVPFSPGHGFNFWTGPSVTKTWGRRWGHSRPWCELHFRWCRWWRWKYNKQSQTKKKQESYNTEKKIWQRRPSLHCISRSKRICWHTSLDGQTHRDKSIGWCQHASATRWMGLWWIFCECNHWWRNWKIFRIPRLSQNGKVPRHMDYLNLKWTRKTRTRHLWRIGNQHHFLYSKVRPSKRQTKRNNL